MCITNIPHSFALNTLWLDIAFVLINICVNCRRMGDLNTINASGKLADCVANASYNDTYELL